MPRVKAKPKTPEPDRDLVEIDRRARQQVSNRSGHRVGHPDANPYDLVADAVMEAVGDAVFAGLASPDFREALRVRGLTLMPTPPQAPPAPADWADKALDLMGAYGNLADPLSVVDELWETAWQCGHTAALTAELPSATL